MKHVRHLLLFTVCHQITLTRANAASDPQTLTAAAVFQKYLDAVGGRPALEAVQTMRVKGICQEGPSTLRFEFSFKTPGKLLFTGRINDQVLVRIGRDRRARCWRQDPQGVRDLDPARLLQALKAEPSH